jgi:multidrug efflux pump subunit AcrA (membrane-fusion protein)
MTMSSHYRQASVATQLARPQAPSILATGPASAAGGDGGNGALGGVGGAGGAGATLLSLGLSAAIGIAVAQSAIAQQPQAPASGTPAVVVPASIQAFFVTDLYAKDSGYISQINYDIGDHVKKGQVLAVIEDPELKAQFDRAKAAVEQAKAALEVARRQLAGMLADLALQQVTLKRQKELFAGKAATAQTLDEAQAKEGVSSATVETGKAKIASAEADLQAAKAEAERLQTLLQYDNIAAPFDGVITRRTVNPGDLVQAATATRPTAPLFTCQKIDVVRVFAEVPEVNAAGIGAGWPAEVRLFGQAGQTVNGSVTRTSNALDPTTRTMRVEIDLPNRDETLLPGMYAQVTLWAPAKPAETNAATSTASQR